VAWVAAASVVASACSNGDGGTALSPGSAEPAQQLSIAGAATLDGAPLVSDFMGARVIRDGRSGACQAAIPVVRGGRYQIRVLSEAESRGCGAPGAEIVLWAYADESFVFSSETLEWRTGGGPVTFDAAFSSSDPSGASRAVTELKGRLYDRDGKQLFRAAVVEAFVGDALCAVTSLRAGGETEGYYTLFVAGPDEVDGCARDGRITFRVDGEPVSGTATNDLAGNDGGREVDLTLQ
jgi:hypothetical protein